jgi:hypothetical protein
MCFVTHIAQWERSDQFGVLRHTCVFPPSGAVLTHGAQTMLFKLFQYGLTDHSPKRQRQHTEFNKGPDNMKRLTDSCQVDPCWGENIGNFEGGGIKQN